MTRVRKSTVLRWIAPVAVAGLLIGGGAVVNAVTASAADASLPTRSAAQLLVDVQQARLGAVSGTVVQSSDLGIPSLPGVGTSPLGGTGSSDLTSLISGTHTLRLWYDGTDKVRIALLGTLGESDVIKNGSDLWIWSSRDNTATHRTLGKALAGTPGTLGKTLPGTSGSIGPSALPDTPQQAADAVLAAIGPSTKVSTDASASVAGRPVYELTLRPRDPAGSLIDRVSIDIDASEHIPLRVQVFAVGHAEPAFSVGFTSVDFSAPDPAQFTFNPPPGATVTDIKPGSDTTKPGSDTTKPGSDTTKPGSDTTKPGEARAKPGDGKTKSGGSAGPGSETTPSTVTPHVVGTGWTSVLVAPSSAVTDNEQLGGILHALPEVSGAWGSGHLLAGTVFSAVITSDGRIAVGAVQPSLLYAALGTR